LTDLEESDKNKVVSLHAEPYVSTKQLITDTYVNINNTKDVIVIATDADGATRIGYNEQSTSQLAFAHAFLGRIINDSFN
jgi:hypothetical protein